MPKYRILLIVILLIIMAITVSSFVVIKNILPGNKTSSIEKEEVSKDLVAYNRAQEYIEKEQYDKAINILSSSIDIFPDSDYGDEFIRDLADLYIKTGEPEKALKYYNMLVSKYPSIRDEETVRGTINRLKSELSPEVNPPESHDLIIYTVSPGDNLLAIARRHGTTVEYIKRLNGLKSDMIMIGQKLKIDQAIFSILVDKKENVMFLNRNGKLYKKYIVATGRDNSTPVGTFKVVDRMIQPPWTKPGVGIIMPDSDEYELGARWMPISVKSYGIHGTNDDSSIGRQSTSGCVRMFNHDVIEVYDLIPKGTEVTIVDSVDGLSPDDGEGNEDVAAGEVPATGEVNL